VDFGLIIFVALLFGTAALLYSSVGHGGGSAYLAVMALAGLEPAVMRPTALLLNVAVAGLVVVRFWRAGQLELRPLLPLLAGSVPLAFVGGATVLPGTAYKVVVGVVLLLAAARLVYTARRTGDDRPTAVPPLPAALLGAGLGLLAGLTGTGGGIFLTPLLLFFGWATPRAATGLSAGFVLLNSLAGLAGNVASIGQLPAELALWLPIVLVAGLLGSELGLRRFNPGALRLALAGVLVVAGLKLIVLG
jgi:hypothetical protein